jgi:hypothetical protein
MTKRQSLSSLRFFRPRASGRRNCPGGYGGLCRDWSDCRYPHGPRQRGLRPETSGQGPGASKQVVGDHKKVSIIPSSLGELG